MMMMDMEESHIDNHGTNNNSSNLLNGCEGRLDNLPEPGHEVKTQRPRDPTGSGGINELIINLDHELWEVRLRAVKFLQRKLDCGLVNSKVLSLRVDLLRRLTDWLRNVYQLTVKKSSGKRAAEENDLLHSQTISAIDGLPCVIRLLLRLAEYENVKQILLREDLESVLIHVRLLLSGECRVLVDKFLELVCTGTLNFHLEGHPELDNTCSYLSGKEHSTARYSTSEFGSEKIMEIINFNRGSGDTPTSNKGIDEPSKSPDFDSSSSSYGDCYFPHQCSVNSSSVVDSWAANGVIFGVPQVHLSGTDRRLLASTVESMLSKNESLVFMTTCFFRDILLQDYPPEVFIQESALSMSVLEAAEFSWNDNHIQDASVQGIIKLSVLLRSRISQLNSSEFYQIKMSDSRSSLPPYTANPRSFSPPMYGSNSSASNTFVNNLIQLLKSVSRSLLFQQRSFHLWKILDNLAFTLCRFVTTFPVDSKNLAMGAHEVLSDISHCYEKSSDNLSSPCVVLCLSSLLHAIHSNDGDFIVSNDVRKCIRRLMYDPELLHCWPEVHQYFMKFASPFDEMRESDFEKLDQEVVKTLLYAVQNATGHVAASEAINNLAKYMLPLQINSRLNENLLDYICKDGPWRDAFYRFLCVEPTCIEDEDLLVKIMELLEFILFHLKDECNELLEWIVPLCMEKGCATLRLLIEHSVKKAGDSYGGTMLTPVLRSLLDFYCTILLKDEIFKIGNEYLWDLFNSYVYILNDISDKDFVFFALLQPVLHGISSLTTKKAVTTQLCSNPKFCLVLVHRVTEVIISLQERSSGLSKDSFKSQGVLYYASLSLLHLAVVINSDAKKFTSSHDWVGRCCAVIPCLWESRDVRVRALGFQLCQIVTNTEKGVIMAMNVMDSSSFVWTCTYGALTDPEEACIVKQSAAASLHNLLRHWNNIEGSEYLLKSLNLPNWTAIDDLTQLLSYVFWLPSLSASFKSNDNQNKTIGSRTSNSNGAAPTDSRLVTPKLLIMICKVLVEMSKSKLPQFHPREFTSAISSSGLCPVLFRLIGTHSITKHLDPNWWIDSCSALSCAIESLICFTQLSKNISIILIGDKRSMQSLLQLFILELPEGPMMPKCQEVLTMLWVNSFILLTTLCRDSGHNFEDFERSIWSQKLTVFTRMSEWLKAGAMARCRQVALTFCMTLLKKLLQKQNEKNEVAMTGVSDASHPVLCREWKEKQETFGSSLCRSLVDVYEDSVNSEEKETVLTSLLSLISISPSSKLTTIEINMISILVKRLRVFGLKHYDSVDTNIVGKKSVVNQWHQETLCILSLLSALAYRSSDAKSRAMTCGMVDALHKIFKWWKLSSDRTLLHCFLEALMNFTEEFPEGSHALTVTTSTIGVGPKRAPTPQSFFIDILGILQQELDSIDKHPNVKTIEFTFEFLKNALFVSECRNILIKSPVVSFITKLHATDMKKWGVPQHEIKIQYLHFLVNLTVHSDMQAGVAKIPEAIEILMTLLNSDGTSSVLALKVLRNLSFQPANKARFLCDDRVLQSLSAKIRHGDTLEEVESASVGLWALIANSEKGKLLAKKSFCHSSVSKAMSRLHKMEHSSNDLLTEKQDVSSLLKVLSNLSNLLGVSSVPAINS